MKKIGIFLLLAFLFCPGGVVFAQNDQDQEIKNRVDLPYRADYGDAEVLAQLQGMAPPPESLTQTAAAEGESAPAAPGAKIVGFLVEARKETIDEVHELLTSLYSTDLDIIYHEAQWLDQRALSNASSKAGRMQQAALSMPAQVNAIIDAEKSKIDSFLSDSVSPEDRAEIAGKISANEASLKAALLDVFKVRVFYLEGARNLTDLLATRRDSFFIDQGRVHIMPGLVLQNFLELGAFVNETRALEKKNIDTLAGLYAAYGHLCEGLLQRPLEAPAAPAPAETPLPGDKKAPAR